MRRTILLAFILLAAAGSALQMRPAHAEALDVWVWDDPVFIVNGQRLSVNVGIRQRDLPAATGVEIVLTVPRGATAKLRYMETTYFTPKVRIVTGDVPENQASVGVTVRGSRAFTYQTIVSADGSMPAAVEKPSKDDTPARALRTSGQSNVPQQLRVKVGR